MDPSVALPPRLLRLDFTGPVGPAWSALADGVTASPGDSRGGILSRATAKVVLSGAQGIRVKFAKAKNEALQASAA